MESLRYQQRWIGSYTLIDVEKMPDARERHRKTRTLWWWWFSKRARLWL